MAVTSREFWGFVHGLGMGAIYPKDLEEKKQ